MSLSPLLFDTFTSGNPSFDWSPDSSDSNTPLPSFSNQVPTSHGHARQLNSLGLSSVSNWAPSDLKPNLGMLYLASHENLLASQNPAYMQLGQRLASLMKESEILQAKFSVLE
jgi:hypothetical protein